MGIWKLTKMNFPKKILGENMSLSIENISTLWSTAEITVNPSGLKRGSILFRYSTPSYSVYGKKIYIYMYGNFMPYITHLLTSTIQ